MSYASQNLRPIMTQFYNRINNNDNNNNNDNDNN